MGALYQVIFTGQLKPDIDPEQAVREFGTVFKVSDDKARQLVLGGQERVLKKEVDEANAERYRALLDEIGLMVRVEPVGGERSNADRSDPGVGRTNLGRGPAGAHRTASAARVPGRARHPPPRSTLMHRRRRT